MRPASEITLPVAWGKLAAKAWGPENGRRVLALHGWLDNAATFDRLVPFLPADFRVVALDLPGHGHSDHRPPGLPYHFIDSVADMLGALDALGWERCSLLGHSLGGGIATILAAAAPERIEKAAVIEAIGPLTAPARDLPNRLQQFLAELGRLPEKKLPVYASIEEAAAARKKVGNLSHEGATLLSERGTKPVPGGVTWRSDPRLRLTTPHRLTEEQVESCLEKISCPVLIVRASDGLPIEPEVWRRRSEAIPKLTLFKVAGGHHVHLDAPESVAPPISAFLTA